MVEWVVQQNSKITSRLVTGLRANLEKSQCGTRRQTSHFKRGWWRAVDEGFITVSEMPVHCMLGLPGCAGGARMNERALLLIEASCNYVIGLLADSASKDFWDPVKKRRILWGWSTGGPPKALPRELTYHPALQSIVQHPVEELAELHEQVVTEITSSIKLAAGEESTSVQLTLPTQ